MLYAGCIIYGFHFDDEFETIEIGIAKLGENSSNVFIFSTDPEYAASEARINNNPDSVMTKKEFLYYMPKYSHILAYGHDQVQLLSEYLPNVLDIKELLPNYPSVFSSDDFYGMDIPLNYTIRYVERTAQLLAKYIDSSSLEPLIRIPKLYNECRSAIVDNISRYNDIEGLSLPATVMNSLKYRYIERKTKNQLFRPLSFLVSELLGSKLVKSILRRTKNVVNFMNPIEKEAILELKKLLQGCEGFYFHQRKPNDRIRFRVLLHGDITWFYRNQFTKDGKNVKIVNYWKKCPHISMLLENINGKFSDVNIRMDELKIINECTQSSIRRTTVNPGERLAMVEFELNINRDLKQNKVFIALAERKVLVVYVKSIVYLSSFLRN